MAGAIRIAIHARSADEADALFDAVAERAARKRSLSMERAGTAGEADVSVYSTASLASEIVADRAALKFLLAPKAQAETYARLAGVVVLPLEEGDDLVRLQARAVVKGLKDKVAAPPPAPAEAPAAVDRAAKKDAKRAAKEAKRAEHKSEKAAEPAPPVAAAEPAVDRAAKKDAKRAAKEAKRAEHKSEKAAEPVVAPAVVEAAPPVRAEKKDAKRAAKQQKRSEKKGEKQAAAPVEAAAPAPDRAEKKAAKRAAKEAKRDAPAETAEDKKAKRALKKQARAEQERAPVAVAAAPASDRAEKKAAKRAAKEAKRGAPVEAAAATVASATDRAEKKAAKRAAKGSPEDRAAKKEAKKKAHKDEARGNKAARKEANKLAKDEGQDGPLETAYRHRLSGFAAPAEAALAAALQAVFQKAGATLALEDDAEEKADFALYAFDDPALTPDAIRAQAPAIAEAKQRTAVFLERAAPGADEINRAIAMLAVETGGALVTLQSLFARRGAQSGSAESYVLIANAVLGLCAGHRVPKHGAGRIAGPAPSDLAEARAAAASPLSFFEQGWNESSPPKLIRSAARAEEVEAFLDSKFLMPSEELRDFTLPIDWGMALPDRRAKLFLLGLEFLHAPLMYWFGKANGQGGEQIATATAALKKRGAVPSQILARTGEIIVDFIRKHPMDTMSDAWDGKTVARRAPVLAAYALCCRVAVRRKLKFDEKVATEVLLGLFDAIELLRADDFYEPCSIQGVRQDCLVIGLGLALRKTAYGERVVADALSRLKRLQLDLGLTSEGVWREGGFGTHCQVLSEISTLLNDLGQTGAEAAAAVAADAKKMTVFVEALVKNNGFPLPIDVSKPRSYAETLSAARRALAGIGMASAKAASGAKSALKPRMMETYVFRDAQYFVSVSSQRVSVEGSQVVLHADRAAPMNEDPGGLSLAFAFGARDLVVRQLPTEKPKSKTSRGTLYDPAMRGGYRIDGEGYVEADDVGARAARIVRSWRGPGWAAARCTDDLYAKGTLARTVVHLKAQHALIVIDEIAASKGEAAFEQAWHMAADLERPVDGGPLRFGNMGVAFDRGETALHAEFPGVSRRVRLAKGVLASVFQWTEDPAGMPRVLVLEEGEAWTVEAEGPGFAAKLQYRGGDLTIALEGGAPLA